MFESKLKYHVVYVLMQEDGITAIKRAKLNAAVAGLESALKTIRAAIVRPSAI